MSDKQDTRPNRQMRQPRLAELVASQLREEILDGRLSEGDSLPRQEDLLRDFNVSLPAVREALRILENEGLLSVRRGNVGGAVVHLPTSERVAYMVGLVLQSQHTTLADVGSALQMLEPICAAMCAESDQRADTLVPELRASVQRQEELIGDAVGYNAEARRFHAAIVSHCGNDTMILMIGSLEAIWSTHERRIYDHADAKVPSTAGWRTSQRAHERLTEAIEAGNGQLASKLAHDHLQATQAFSLGVDVDRSISAVLLG